MRQPCSGASFRLLHKLGKRPEYLSGSAEHSYTLRDPSRFPLRGVLPSGKLAAFSFDLLRDNQGHGEREYAKNRSENRAMQKKDYGASDSVKEESARGPVEAAATAARAAG